MFYQANRTQAAGVRYSIVFSLFIFNFRLFFSLKSTFLAHINSNKVYFKFILFLSIAALRVCVEDRHSFTESRRVPATRGLVCR